MAKGGRIEGRVRAVGRGGDSIVETPEGIVFAQGALPDERVEIERVGSRRGAKRGELAEILEPSSERRQPACEAADRCGGCPLMIASPALQRRIKEGFLVDAYKGLPGADAVTLRWVRSERQEHYRRRARLAWRHGVLGYRRRNSRRVVDVEACLVLEPELERAWRATRDHVANLLDGEGEVQLSRTLGGVVVEMVSEDPQSPELFRACEALCTDPAIAGVACGLGAGAPASWGQVDIEVPSLDGLPLHAPLGGFSQANDLVNQRLVEEVVRLAAPEGMRVLELHCGIGNFTVGLADGAAKLVAVERDRASTEACRHNVSRRGLNASIVEGDASNPPKGQYDVVVLDPPRQGARAFFEQRGVWASARRIVYVSCDTATLARDLRLACNEGFAIDEAVAFDMFPQTAHLESVVRLVR
ncbi:MAG: methyltransferase domain-containing protein [Myxococcota bacterium]